MSGTAFLVADYATGTGTVLLLTSWALRRRRLVPWSIALSAAGQCMSAVASESRHDWPWTWASLAFAVILLGILADLAARGMRTGR